MFNEVPAKVLECFVDNQQGEGAWPYNDGSLDPYWRFGSNPRDYRWTLTVQVKHQRHSSYKTRQPKTYTGMDVKVGDYIASAVDGTAVKIIRIDTKTDDSLVCVVEDVFRYNTFRDPSGAGLGLFNIPGPAIIFETNDTGMPCIDPIPSSGVGQNFHPNLFSRFQSLETTSHFLLNKKEHGFEVGQLVSVDPEENSFILTDGDHPYIVGRVSSVNGPNHFTVNPIQKVIDDIDHLIGEVGDVLYAQSGVPGDIGLSGINPVLLKLRDNTVSRLRGTVMNATTAVGSILSLNGVNVTIGGAGALTDLVFAVNASTTDHDIQASVVPNRTVVATIPSSLAPIYGEVLLAIPTTGTPPKAKINEVDVTFTTYEIGMLRYGERLATAEDMAHDIIAANVPNLTVKWTDNSLILREDTGQTVQIINVVSDANGTPFCGSNSATGLAATTAGPGGWFVRFEAPDARAINVANVIGNPLEDFGLNSVENGTKAAAIYIEQGLRKSSNYVVSDIAARDALEGVLGDQAHVLDKGDGDWGLYVYAGSSWTLIATAGSAKTDADTYVVEISPASANTIDLGRVPAGSKIANVTFEVLQNFPNGLPSISVGDSVDHARLANDDHVDLNLGGKYVVTPSHVYDASTILRVYWAPGTATTGLVKVSVSYM